MRFKSIYSQTKIDILFEEDLRWISLPREMTSLIRILFLMAICILFSCSKGRNVRKIKKNCNCPEWSQTLPADEIHTCRVQP
ncbi:MAG: hypothetical protein HKN79_00295 [Flavobacteriales bacterium]|nr:hypothetical protein [Flavobacteriales bacterium]